MSNDPKEQIVDWSKVTTSQSKSSLNYDRNENKDFSICVSVFLKNRVATYRIWIILSINYCLKILKL